MVLHDHHVAGFGSSTKRHAAKAFAAEKWKAWAALSRAPEVCAILNARTGNRIVGDVVAWAYGTEVAAAVRVV